MHLYIEAKKVLKGEERKAMLTSRSNPELKASDMVPTHIKVGAAEEVQADPGLKSKPVFRD